MATPEGNVEASASPDTVVEPPPEEAVAPAVDEISKEVKVISLFFLNLFFNFEDVSVLPFCFNLFVLMYIKLIVSYFSYCHMLSFGHVYSFLCMNFETRFSRKQPLYC